jgi:hypothetical protein
MDENWVKVFSASKIYEIEIIKGLLAESNIESVEMSQKDSSFLIGSIDLFVHKEDFDKASEIIKSHHNKQ